jgi:hypothetical protein
MTSLRGKSLSAVARDIAEGYIIVNPLFLKPLDVESLKGLFEQLMKVQSEVRADKFPFNDVQAIRRRNMRLQRLHSSLMIIRNFVKERKIRGFI